MTQEEKAKAYDKAIKRAKAMIKVAANQDEAIAFTNTIFPELTESEDERIRKLLISGMKNLKYNAETFASIPIKDVIDWLEKQELKSNPYSGVSFSYNGNIWGMCARDNGVDILFNKKLIQHINLKI